MPVEVVFLGAVEETFPARLGNPWCARIPLQRRFPRRAGAAPQQGQSQQSGGQGLLDGITVAGLDLSEAPGGLLDSEKAALCWRFGETHGVETVAATFGELAEGGYLTPVSPEGETPLYRMDFRQSAGFGE